MLKKGWILLVISISQVAWAFPPCGLDSSVGSFCSLDINQLHPTQAGVGQLQVDKTQTKLARKNQDQLEKYMKKKEIPVVVDTDGQYWLVDRHHLTKALWQQGMKKVVVNIIARLNNKESFWRDMQDNHWAWLRDEKGNPLTPAQLPEHIGKLPDYPYRSLAGELQDDGYYGKYQQVYFVEFAWASWLGEQMKWAPVNATTLPARLKQAKQLACDPSAKMLPGYPGEQCQNVRRLIKNTNQLSYH